MRCKQGKRQGGSAVRGSPRLLLLLVALACSPGSEVSMERTFDLVGNFPLATVNGEPGNLDLGAPEGRGPLLYGWSWNERQVDSGMSFVWSSGPSSALEFFLVEPREWRLEMRCFPFHVAGEPAQEISIELNGEAVSQVLLGPEIGNYEVRLPQRALRSGRNVLRLGYRYTGASEGDGRQLAVGWDALRFEPADRASSPAHRHRTGPAVESLPDQLWIPFGYQVDYYLDLGPGSVLRFEDLRATGRGELVVAVAWDGTGERRVARLRGRQRDARLPLEGPAGPTRLTLRSVAPGSRNGFQGGVSLEAPAVWSRAPAREATAEDRGSPTGDQRPRRPNVIIYMIDTLRADHLGCYGYPRPTSPNIDAFAAQAILYEEVIAQSSWTRPAVASILTGLGPLEHGVNEPTHQLSEQVLTLAEVLQGFGYRTAAFSTNGNVSPDTGFAQGFDHFDLLVSGPNLSDEVNRRVLGWLDRAVEPDPFFLYIHTIDPHAPYEPVAEFRRRFAPQVHDPRAGSIQSIRGLGDKTIDVTEQLLADVVNLYDAEVAFNDHHFGELRRALESRGLEDGSLIVLLSDHGEEFNEHGVFGHGWDLYREVLHVPLIVKLPHGRRGRRVSEPVQHIDLLPTVLEYLRLPVPHQLGGRSLLQWGRESGVGEERRILSYMNYEGREGASLIQGSWKLIEPLVTKFARAQELYDRSTDQQEHHSLADHHPVLSGYLATLIHRQILDTAKPASEQAPLSEKTRRQLEALGYL